MVVKIGGIHIFTQVEIDLECLGGSRSETRNNLAEERYFQTYQYYVIILTYGYGGWYLKDANQVFTKPHKSKVARIVDCLLRKHIEVQFSYSFIRPH